MRGRRRDVASVLLVFLALAVAPVAAAEAPLAITGARGFASTPNQHAQRTRLRLIELEGREAAGIVR